MTSDAPGPDQPAPGGPPAPPDDTPTEAVPPPPPGQWPAPAAPAQPAPAAPHDASEDAPAAPLDAPAAPLDAPASPLDAPAAPPVWGAPPAAATQPAASLPAAPQQAAPPPVTPQPGPPAQPGQWGAPPQQAAPGWGAPAAPPQPGYGAPPPAGYGAPGGAPPTGTWNPEPAKSSGNGCLKGCIIVGVILVIVVAVVIAAFVFFANQFVNDLGVDTTTGGLKQCELVTGPEIDQVFGGTGAEVVPMGGLVDATIGTILDRRVLADANDCWILTSGTNSSVTGRIARQESINASGDFQAAKSAATAGSYFGGDSSGVGDESFCTGASEESPSFGVLVRQGGSLVYVSLIDPTFASQGDWQTTDDGVLISPRTCQLASQVAAAVLR